MNQEENNTVNGIPIHKQVLSGQVRPDLTCLNNEELLNQLASSPCANQNIARDQSLEEYLRKVKPKKESPLT